MKDVTEARLLTGLTTFGCQAFGWGTHAYLVRRDFAGWLSGEEPQFTMPIDSWLRALAEVPHHRIFRTRQDLWAPDEGESTVDAIGR